MLKMQSLHAKVHNLFQSDKFFCIIRHFMLILHAIMEQTTPTSDIQGHNVVKKEGVTRQLFMTFVRIGAFTLGGGYAMIPIIEEEVVRRHGWIDREEFIDLIAVAQSCPGVFAINISTFIGYKLRATKGALAAASGAALPSFVIILVIAMFFQQFADVAWVASCFNGIRPAVVALIAAPTFTLAKSANINLTNFWIPVASALLIWLLGVNPVFIIIAAGLGGYIYGLLEKGEKDVTTPDGDDTRKEVTQ